MDTITYVFNHVNKMAQVIINQKADAVIIDPFKGLSAAGGPHVGPMNLLSGRIFSTHVM